MRRQCSARASKPPSAQAPPEPDSEPEPEPEPEEAPSAPRISVDGSEALALTLSERIARGRAPTEPA